MRVTHCFYFPFCYTKTSLFAFEYYDEVKGAYAFISFVVPNGHEAEVKIEPNTGDMNVSYHKNVFFLNKNNILVVALLKFSLLKKKITLSHFTALG